VITRLPTPPVSLLQGASLFLDLDGTLLELIDSPEDVIADPQLRRLLLALNDKLEGRIAVVSGRSLEQLDAILGAECHAIALSGSHGCEHRWRGIAAAPKRPPELDIALDRLRAFAETRDGVSIENKSYGAALHYRRAPEQEEAARALVRELGATLDLHVQDGKMMAELRVPGGDKGAAVRRLMARAPMAGTRPIFVGDDLTDEAGMQAARDLGGEGILVGPPRETAARYGLTDPAAVRAWLQETLA
jgi:trehalose 6-phosphate phosphatase